MATTKASGVPTSVPRGSRFGVLRHRDFRILWFGMVFSGSTFTFQWVAQSWFIVQTTESPLALGILGGGRGLVAMLMSVYGGVLADRLDRRHLLIISQTAAMLIYATLSALVLLDMAPLWLVFILIFLSSAALAVDRPVRQALVPEVVPKQDIPNAMALVMAAQMGAFAYLPPLAGVAMNHLGIGWTFVLSLVGHVGIIVAVLLMRHRGGAPRPPVARRSLWADAAEGFRYTFNERTILWLFVMMLAMSSLGWPLIATLGPLWLKVELGMSAIGFTLITSAWGTATLVSAVYLAQLKSSDMLGRIFLASALSFCGSLVLFAFTRSIPLVVVAWAINGLTFSASRIAMVSIIQRTIPNEIRGRIMGLETLSRSISQLSGFPLSLIAEVIGLVLMASIMVLVCTGVCVMATVFTPTLRRMARDGPG